MKGLLKVVTGPKIDDVAALAAEIEAEKTKAAEACAEIERIEAAQRTADTYEQARAMDGAIAEAKWVVERATAILPGLEAKLKAAKADQLAAAIAHHRAILRRRYPKFRAALLEAVEQQAAVIQEREEAAREIGEHAVATHLPNLAYAGFLYREFVALWTAEQDRVFTDPPPRPAVAGPRPAPAPAKPAAPEHGWGWTRKRNEPTAPPEPAPRPPRQRRRDTQAGQGQKLVTILRNGVDVDGYQAANGDVLAVSIATAEALVKGGAAEFAEPSGATP